MANNLGDIENISDPICMSWFRGASLYLSLCLALHAGLFLVPTEDLEHLFLVPPVTSSNPANLFKTLMVLMGFEFCAWYLVDVSDLLLLKPSSF